MMLITPVTAFNRFDLSSPQRCPAAPRLKCWRGRPLSPALSETSAQPAVTQADDQQQTRKCRYVGSSPRSATRRRDSAPLHHVPFQAKVGRGKRRINALTGFVLGGYVRRFLGRFTVA